jgi:hypothetical protein
MQRMDLGDAHRRTNGIVKRAERRVGDEQSQNAALWSALRSDEPIPGLIGVVEVWKSTGCTQSEAESRLTSFLHEVMAKGAVDEDDPVRDVLDLVVGFCSPQARLFK